MGDLVRATGAAARAANAVMRAVGGRSVMLRVPAPAMGGDVTEQLGIAPPVFQDLSLAPVAFRKGRVTTLIGKAARRELLVSATAVEQLVGSLASASASVLFATAVGILVDDEVLTIESATEEQAFGEPYMYRLVLLAPLAQID